MPTMFDPNAQQQQQPGQFDFETRQAALEQRKRLLAALMRRQEQASAEAAPDGRMVGRIYVNANPLEHLAHIAKPLMAQWGAQQEQKGIEADTAALSQADREAAAAHIARMPAARPELSGPRDESGSPELDASTPTTQDKLKWAQEGMSIPSRRDVLSKVITDLEVNEPVRQDARAEKRMDREDRQAESRATLQANLELKREQLAQAAEAARQRSEDTRASIDQRREAAQMHAGLMRELAQMRADAKAGDAAKGKTLPQSALKDIGALEETAARIGNLQREFDPSYAGLKGAAATIAGNNIPGVTTKASEWWKNYRKEAELVERHAMFGASLTENEQKAWRSADISPTMAPEAIQRNLTRRAELAQKVFANAVDRQQRAGYNARDAFGTPEPQRNIGGAGGAWDDSTAPVRVSSKAERDRLPKGTRYMDPQGNVATR